MPKNFIAYFRYTTICANENIAIFLLPIFEDSRNGVISAQAAGLRVIVTPSRYTAAEDFSMAEWVVADLGARNIASIEALSALVQPA